MSENGVWKKTTGHTGGQFRVLFRVRLGFRVRL